jgi:S1-C subfamily serine protease
MYLDMRSTLKKFLFPVFICFVVFGFGVSASAQTPAPVAAPSTIEPQEPTAPGKPKPQKVIRRASTRPARVSMVRDQEPVAPQVVTVVHRLSGVKLLRYLLRESGDRTIATIDPESIANDAHASIIAGLELEDGRTIVARLPQVAAEMEVPRVSPVPPDKSDDLMGNALRRLPRMPRMQPDLTVMMQDGRTFRARYIGIDGLTGLSVLQLAEPAAAATANVSARKIATGENVQLFAPEQVPSEAPYTILVRIGKTEAQVAKAIAARADAQRVMLRGAKLLPGLIGSVACDESGNTLGIVDQLEGANAQLLTVDAVRAAVRRVLERQASVPRPLLGIRGEAIDFATRKALLEYGWNEQQLRVLIEKQVGILLTLVMPGTPAALANLHPGDVIVRVNDKDVKGAEDFSTILTDAGSGEEVKFTVQRPQLKTPLSLDVRLGGAYQPSFEWQFEMPEFPKFSGGLKTLGVEAVALSTKSASQWGGSGVLVVAIEPESAAARAGLREGDVIESIDGRPVGRGAWTFVYQFNRKEKHVFSVVREREKKQVVLDPVE